MIFNFRDAVGLVSILMMIASPFVALWNFGDAVLFLLAGIIVFNIADN